MSDDAHVRAGVRRLLAEIEAARDQAPEVDSDHDEYVSAQETLWDLRARLGGG